MGSGVNNNTVNSSTQTRVRKSHTEKTIIGKSHGMTAKVINGAKKGAQSLINQFKKTYTDWEDDVKDLNKSLDKMSKKIFKPIDDKLAPHSQKLQKRTSDIAKRLSSLGQETLQVVNSFNDSLGPLRMMHGLEPEVDKSEINDSKTSPSTEKSHEQKKDLATKIQTAKENGASLDEIGALEKEIARQESKMSIPQKLSGKKKNLENQKSELRSIVPKEWQSEAIKIENPAQDLPKLLKAPLKEERLRDTLWACASHLTTQEDGSQSLNIADVFRVGAEVKQALDKAGIDLKQLLTAEFVNDMLTHKGMQDAIIGKPEPTSSETKTALLTLVSTLT